MPKKNTKFGRGFVYQQPPMQQQLLTPQRGFVWWARLIAEIAGFVTIIVLIADFFGWPEPLNYICDKLKPCGECGSVCGSDYVCITTPEPCDPCEKGSPGSPGS